MPARSEDGWGCGLKRSSKIFGHCETQNLGRADGDVRVSGEIEEQL